jgi:poly(beta-D-mannuronate) lyase
MRHSTPLPPSALRSSLGILTLLLGGTILSDTGLSTEYHVGTPAAITAAMATAQPGDTLTMDSGTWTDAAIVFRGQGSNDLPILLRALSPGAVTLTGKSTLRIAGTYLSVDGLAFRGGYAPSGAVIEFRDPSNGAGSSHCRMTNCTIADYNPPNDSTDYKWISLYGAYNRVDHCALSGKTHSGTTLVVWLSNTPNYHLIDHNYFGPRPALGYNGGETIRVGTSDWSMYDSFTTVESNVFDRCDGEMEIISNKSCGNIYRYNTFLNSKGTLTLRHGNRCRVEGNFFFGNGISTTGGIRIIGEDHVVVNNYVAGTNGTGFRAALSMVDGIADSPLNGYYQVKRAVVAYNTFVGNYRTFDIGAGKSSSNVLPPLDCRIANNVVLATSGPIVTYTDTPINLSWEGNIFYGASVGLTPLPSGITVVDPRLAAVGADGLRHIEGSSPAINASVGSTPVVVDDMDGQQRDATPDVGADEFSAGPAVRKPLLPADVGPGTGTTDVGDRPVLQPGETRLEMNYPNPFNPSTTIGFHVSATGRAVVEVFDLLGTRVATLFDGTAHAGISYAVKFDASALATGVYFTRLVAGERHVVQKMVLTR